MAKNEPLVFSPYFVIETAINRLNLIGYYLEQRQKMDGSFSHLLHIHLFMLSNNMRSCVLIITNPETPEAERGQRIQLADQLRAKKEQRDWGKGADIRTRDCYLLTHSTTFAQIILNGWKEGQC